MTTNFITKRPHKKSRGGCQTCKTKKVKCDEAQPKCSFCEKRNFKCQYVYKSAKISSDPDTSSPSPSSLSSDAFTPPSDADQAGLEIVLRSEPIFQMPEPALVTASGNLSQLDLKLMHFWSTSTWNTINVGTHSDHVLLVHAPQLGFENPFLLNCLLGIASLHMEYLEPDSREIRQQTSVYRVRALNSFREAVASLDPKSEGWEASLLMALLLIVLCSKDYNTSDEDLTVINWLVLYRGLSSIISMRSWPEVEVSKVSPLFRRELTPLQSVPLIPANLLEMAEGIGPLDPDFEYLEHYCTALDALGILYAGLRQDGPTYLTHVRVVAWASFLSMEFAKCAREKRPRALVILAHYLVFLKVITSMWWLEGSADFQIRMIEKMVGPEWLPYLDVPRQSTFLTDPSEITTLLLR